MYLGRCEEAGLGFQEGSWQQNSTALEAMSWEAAYTPLAFLLVAYSSFQIIDAPFMLGICCQQNGVHASREVT